MYRGKFGKTFKYEAIPYPSAPRNSSSSQPDYSLLGAFLSTNLISATNASKHSAGTASGKTDCQKKDSVNASDKQKQKVEKIDINRFNELDAFSNRHQFYQFPCSRTFMNHFLKPPNELKKANKESKDPVAGPSHSKKKKKLKQTPSQDSEDSSLEEAKSIATCILENSLNRIDSHRDLQIIEQLTDETKGPPEGVSKVEDAELAEEEFQDAEDFPILGDYIFYFRTEWHIP